MQSSAETTPKVAEHPQRARLIPIGIEELGDLTPMLVPWIEKAISKDHRQDVPTIMDALHRGEMQAWVGWVPAENEIIVLLLSELVQYPRRKVFVCAFVAANKPPSKWLHLFEDVEAYARHAGADEMETHHRFRDEMRLLNRVYVKELKSDG